MSSVYVFVIDEENLLTSNVQSCLEKRVSELVKDLKEANNSTVALNKDNASLKKEVEDLTCKVSHSVNSLRGQP